MKKRWKFIGGAAMICIWVGVQLVPVPAAAKNKDMTVGLFAKMLEKETGLEQLAATMEENDALDKKLDRTTAAKLANQADELLHKSQGNNRIEAQVKEKKRIIGLGKQNTGDAVSVRKCFAKGIMIGDSLGKCSQARTWNGSKLVSRSEAEQVIQRVINPKKRIKISPDGQVIRTTKLPSNYKKYEYILESFPNEFYEKKFKYQLKTYSYKPKNLKDYAAPVDVKKMTWEIPFWNATYKTKDILDKNLDNWCKKVELNLNKRLNFDYRTVDHQWVSELRSTYFVFDDAKQDKKQTDKIKTYVKLAKKNKVVIKSACISVEPSSLYFDGPDFFIRCYLRFNLVANNIPNAITQLQNSIIFGEQIYLINLKNGWYDGYFDISLASSCATDTGEDFAVSVDSLIKE